MWGFIYCTYSKVCILHSWVVSTVLHTYVTIIIDCAECRLYKYYSLGFLNWMSVYNELYTRNSCCLSYLSKWKKPFLLWLCCRLNNKFLATLSLVDTHRLLKCQYNSGQIYKYLSHLSPVQPFFQSNLWKETNFEKRHIFCVLYMLVPMHLS